MERAPAEPPRGRGGEIVLAVLVALSGAGIAVSRFSAEYGLWYWLAMVPVFGGVSLVAGWSRARESGATGFAVLRTQLLHWGGLLLAVPLVFLLERTGRLNSADAGLVALLTLALGTFLAGVHFDWRLGAVGVLLGAAVAIAAVVQRYLLLLLVPVVLVVVLVVLRARRAAHT